VVNYDVFNNKVLIFAINKMACLPHIINHGNYLSYGLAATTLWVLGIPHGLA